MFASKHDPSRVVRPQAPVCGSQASTVHGLPSSHETAAWTQSPVIGSQESVVHGRPSSQFREGAWQPIAPSVATAHLSPRVQAFRSSHSAP
jgi:hypothetical protein